MGDKAGQGMIMTTAIPRFEPLVTQRSRTARYGTVVLVCEHASNAFPEPFGDLGLDAGQRHAHIAWDPGASALSRRLQVLLDADLVEGVVSRLIFDCNRPRNAASACPSRSEIHEIPGNRDLLPEEKNARAQAIYEPFHTTLSALLSARGTGVLISVHSFTPVYFGRARSTEIGFLHGSDARLADRLLASWPPDAPARADRNMPYGPADEGVMHTVERHAREGEWPSVMIEVRNDLIATPQGQACIAGALARQIRAALPVGGQAIN